MVAIWKVCDEILRQYVSIVRCARTARKYEGKVPCKFVGVGYQLGRPCGIHEADGDVRTQPLRIAKFHYQHAQRLDIPGILQGTRIYRSQSGIADQYCSLQLGVAIVAAVEHRWPVVAEQMSRGLQKPDEHCVECFNDNGASGEFRDLLCSGAGQAHFEPAGTTGINATEDCLSLYRSGG